MLQAPTEQSKVLVLDGNSKAAAECLLALPRGCELHVSERAEYCLGFASRRVARRLVQPGFTDDLRQWVLARDRECDYDLVIPSTEVALLAMKSQALDPRLRAKLVIPDERAIDIALDKWLTVEAAREVGVKAPWTTLVEDGQQIAPASGFPTVLKPIHSKVATPSGVVSLSVKICSNETERQNALRRMLQLTPVLEQEYFAGRGIGIEMLFENGAPRWAFAHERVHELPVDGGASTYRRSIEPPPQLLEASIRLLEHLRWHGVGMVEFKLAANGDYRLMEINPRLWGSLPLAVMAGVNFPLGLLRIARGAPVGEQPRFRRHVYARDLAKDAVWFAQSWRQRRNPLAVQPLRVRDFIALARPLVGRERWDLFRWRERELWWRLTLDTLRSMRARLRSANARTMSAANWRRLAVPWRRGQINRVLFLCYGNICRSPLTALLLAKLAPGLDITSAGFYPEAQRHSPLDWVEAVAATLDVDLAPHRSHTLSRQMIENAELIVVMDAANWQALAKFAPHALARTILLGSLAPDANLRHDEIPDPYCKPPGDMKSIAAMMDQCVANLARQHGSDPSVGGDSAADHQAAPLRP